MGEFNKPVAQTMGGHQQFKVESLEQRHLLILTGATYIKTLDPLVFNQREEMKHKAKLHDLPL